MTLNNVTGATIQSNSPTGGIGYTTGAGGAAVQATDKNTAVTINALSGQITLAPSSLSAGAIAIFTVYNTSILDGDLPYVVHTGVGAFGAYVPTPCNIIPGVSFQISIVNLSTTQLAEAIVINFNVFRGASS